MPGLGDEAALALERSLEPGEHLVERLAEPLELVTRARHRQPLSGAVGRDLRRPSTHRLDRSEAGSGEHVAEAGRQQKRDRARKQELGPQAAERLGAVLARRSHDEDGTRASEDDRRREQARRLVEAGHRGYVDELRLAERRPKLGRGQERAAAERRRRVEDRAGRADELGEALAALHEPARSLFCQRAPPVADERRDVLRAEAEVLVERVREIAAEARVDERARAREHERHRSREGGGDANTDRNASHASSRSR